MDTPNIKIKKKYFVIGNLMLENIKILNKMKKSIKILKNILNILLTSF